MAGELELLQHQAGMVKAVVGMNLDGVTQAESLVQPQPAGNCLNWVLGHLLYVYNASLPLVGEESVVPPQSIERYNRGSQPLRDASEARSLDELRSLWETVTERFGRGLARLAPEALDRPAPFSPSNNPNETVRTLLSTIVFHQSYHAGQLGVLRRVAGKEGAVR